MGDRLPVLEPDGPVVRVFPDHASARDDLDALLGPEAGRPYEDALERLDAGAIPLRERRPLVGRLLDEDGDSAIDAALAKGDRGLRAAVARADHDDVEAQRIGARGRHGMRTAFTQSPRAWAATASLMRSSGKVAISLSNGKWPARWSSTSSGMKLSRSLSPSMMPWIRWP